MSKQLYLAGLFNGPMSRKKRAQIKELVSAAIEVDHYLRSHPEVFSRYKTLDGAHGHDGTSPYHCLWRLKDAVIDLYGDRVRDCRVGAEPSLDGMGE